MKYIKTYSDNAAYEADKPNFEVPHVGYIEGSDEVKYVNDMADLYDFYGTVTNGTNSLTYRINDTTYSNQPVSNGYFKYVWTGGTITSLRQFVKSNGSIKTIDGLSFDTSNVTTMQEMFAYASNVTSIDLSKLNTSSVTNMERVFDHCTSLQTIDVSNFDTSNVTTMQGMFDTVRVTTLDLSSFNTSGVTNMDSLFSQTSKLTTINMSNWNLESLQSTSIGLGKSPLVTVIANNTNQVTFQKIKDLLIASSRTSCQIIRDGLTWTYNGSEWVSN